MQPFISPSVLVGQLYRRLSRVAVTLAKHWQVSISARLFGGPALSQPARALLVTNGR